MSVPDRNIADVLVPCDSGIIQNMQRPEYAKRKQMNSSSLKCGLIGATDIDPVLIKNAYEETRAAPSAALQDSYDRGTLAHTILLEPEKLVDSVAVWNGVRSGNEWHVFKAENAGKLVMRASDVRDVQAACRVVRGIQPVNELLRRRHDTELAVFGQVGRTYCKGMLDFVSTDDGPVTITDLKTSRRPLDEESINREIRRLFYREQLGLYAHLYEQATGRPVEKVLLLFVSLETAGVRLVRLTTSAIQFGFARMVAAIEAVEKCIDANEWPTFYAESLMDCSNWELDDIDIEGI